MNAESTSPDKWIKIGKLGKPHGIKGEIRLYSLSDVPDRFRHLTTVWWQGKSDRIERLQVEGVRPVERFFLVRFKGYHTPEDVKKLSNGYLVIPQDQRGDLPEGRFFIDDIIGLKVIDEAGTFIGHVTEVWQPGPNDVYEIHGPGGELLIPVIDEVIKEINLQEKTMVIKVPDAYEQA